MKPALIKTIEELKPLDKPAGVIAGWVHKTTRSDVVKNTLTGTWLGHPLHPMLTDVPIGAWSMASVLD